MKKFVVADVQELNINETANGCFDFFFEICRITNDDLLDNCHKKPETPSVDPDDLSA